ncbi:MAG: F0F1 ATP synthase subunit delta [Tissierellia bacterium]|nr:F0F1 ATP synthase subunit delta [Tissierellia bacterium]
MSSLVAEKYGQALFEVAEEQDKLNEYREESKEVHKIFEENELLLQILDHPEIRSDVKKNIVADIFEKGISEEMLHFLYITIDKKRTRYIQEILKEYEILYQEEKNIKQALLVTSVPATEEQLKALQGLLEKKTGGTIQVENQVDPSIIGGAVLEMDGKRMDHSISHELNQLRFQIKEATL